MNKSGVRRQRASELCGYTVLPTVWVRALQDLLVLRVRQATRYQEYALCVALAWFAALKRERSRVHSH